LNGVFDFIRIFVGEIQFFIDFSVASHQLIIFGCLYAGIKFLHFNTFVSQKLASHGTGKEMLYFA